MGNAENRDLPGTIQTHIGKVAFSLSRAGYFLATAESCTGGMIAAACTDVAGSSTWFRGGIVAYANELKEKLLGVPAAVLEKHGAVSAPVVERMALGALRACNAQAAIAVSGVAGPGGGTEDKPAGTVWIAVAVVEEPGVCAFGHPELDATLPGCSRVKHGDRDAVVYVARYLFDGNRAAVRLRAVERSLRDLAALLELDTA